PSLLSLLHLSLLFFSRPLSPPDPYTLSLHDALPICSATVARVAQAPPAGRPRRGRPQVPSRRLRGLHPRRPVRGQHARRHLRGRSEEHTSELQSPDHLVCRLLLEKKKKNK